MSLKAFKIKLFEIHGDNVKIQEDSFVNLVTPCIFFDCVYGYWKRTPKSILLYKTRHPQFKIDETRNKSIEDIKNKLLKLHNGIVTLLEQSFTSWAKKCDFLDADYGIWSSTPINVIAGGNGHPERSRIDSSNRLRMNLDVLKERIYDIHGEIVTIVDDTYNGYSKNATFIDKDYGSWITKPYCVIGWMKGAKGCSVPSAHPKRSLERRRKTFTERYGVDNPMKLDWFQSKVAKAVAKNRTKAIHWKTNEELTCHASYEAAFVKWANENKIDFDWQIPHKIPNGKTYWVDAYIKSGTYKGNWIEIKGYLRKGSKEKWDWFHSKNENSIIWFKKDLIELGIL